jgi:hypothetical protein
MEAKMGERQVRGNQEGEFDVSADNVKEKPVTIILPLSLRENCTVFKKDIPPSIPTTWTDSSNITYKIEWFTNFGIKQDGVYKKRLDKSFKVKLKKVIGKKLFYYDDGVQVFDNIQDVPGTDQIVVELNAGDPPLGWEGGS